VPAIRRAVPDDAPALAAVHVRAWQAAYRGMMSDDYLDGLDVGEREHTWSAWLGQEHGILVVEDDVAGVAGFAITGIVRDGEEPGDRSVGELYAINLAPEHWDHGLGRALLTAATDQLRRQGYAEATLWVVDANQRARRFYEIAGWSADGAVQIDEQLGVREIRYRRRL
jgi:GNAT superfamily N-acetyltransferase